MISRTRGYLPHFQSGSETYFVTFRLAGTLPATLVVRWKQEFEHQKTLLKDDPERLNELEKKYFLQIDNYLHQDCGPLWLNDPEISKIVSEAIRYFDGQRYVLHAWTIMPNHVHVLVSLKKDYTLSSILHSWKSFSANRANQLLGRSGPFWQREYYDRAIRNEKQFEFCLRYILNNPVKAGLCKEVYQWRWTGCSEELEPMMRRFFLD